MNGDTPDSGFLDVATNALAVIVIATMFTLLTVETETTERSDPRFDGEPSLTLRTQPPLAERPFLDYYFVFDGVIVRWEQERYVELLAVEGLRDPIALPGGKLRVSVAAEPRDPDSFTASFIPDLSALAGLATVLTLETAESVASAILERHETGGTAPNFIVYPSGMESFEMLYHRLRDAPIWLRWFLWEKDTPLKIERRARHFASFEFDF